MVPALEWSWCCLLLQDDSRLRNSRLSMSLAGREGVGAGLWNMVYGWRWLTRNLRGRPLEDIEEELAGGLVTTWLV